MSEMNAPGNLAPPGYPSPTGTTAQPATAHPFYHTYSQHQPQNQTQQDSGAEDVSDGEADARQPEDPALRTHFENMMGTFGGFNPPMMQHPQNADGSMSSMPPPGSVAFAQSHASQSADPSHSAGATRTTGGTPRIKVSRACDECRRKKIRCDAVDESGTTPCSNCARTGSKCGFTRLPMKRGPSKGYIKELAERLNTLERQVGPSGSAGQGLEGELERLQREAEEQGVSLDGAVDPQVGDKRTFAVAEGLQNDFETRREHDTQHPYYVTPTQSSSADRMQPFWRPDGNNTNRQATTSTPFEAESTSPTTSVDWDEAVVDEYYRIIHQTLPLLPHNKNRLRQRLAECPASLREGFLAALDCTMRTFPTPTTNLKPSDNYPQALRKAVEMLARYPFDNPSTHTNSTNLVYLQTLLLMALEADNHGPATVRGQAGPSRAEWLGRAAGVAGQLEINVIRKGNESIVGGDPDSEERLARRVWWVLFILDRWHASSTADLLKLPENSVVLLPEDQILLGESTYHLARLSFIIGHLAAILTTTKTPSTDVMSPSNPASSLLGLTLAGEIDRFRESVESVWGSFNLVHLSYHHVHLLIKRLNPTTEPLDLVGHAVKVAAVLNSQRTPVTPLNHHFAALAAMTLCELADIAKTRAEAVTGLDHLGEALGTGRGLAGHQESEGWDGAIRELVAKKKERMQSASSLDALADAAGADADGEKSFEPTMLTRYGYLTALGQGLFRTK